jgi:hypothetical protein
VEDDPVAPGGYCARCGLLVPERVTIDYVEQGSGPGASVMGCLPCARALARQFFAPQWLKDAVATLDAERQAA